MTSATLGFPAFPRSPGTHQGVEAYVPRASLEICVESVLDDGLLVPRQLVVLGRPGTQASSKGSGRRY